MSGFVYIVGPKDGPFKVGSTGNIRKRLDALQTAHPVPLAVHAKWQHLTPRAVELEAHEILKAFRMRGEWFSCSLHQAALGVELAIKRLKVDGPLFSDDDLVVVPEDWPDKPARLDPERHSVGYVRPLPDVVAPRQSAWMIKSGVDPRDIWVEDGAGDKELKYAMKDMQDGDQFLVWSSAVFISPLEYGVFLVEAAERGVNVIAGESE